MCVPSGEFSVPPHHASVAPPVKWVTSCGQGECTFDLPWWVPHVVQDRYVHVCVPGPGVYMHTVGSACCRLKSPVLVNIHHPGYNHPSLVKLKIAGGGWRRGPPQRDLSELPLPEEEGSQVSWNPLSLAYH